MEKYKFTVDGIPVSVYPLSEPLENREEIFAALCEGELAVILHPDFDLDFRIECFDRNNIEPREPGIPLSALFCFFSRVRGYPDTTLLIGYHNKEYALDVSREKEHSFSVNGEKCKMLYANNLVFGDGIEICVNSVSANGIYAVYCCTDAELACNDRVELILLRMRERGVKAAVAFSFSDNLCLKTAPIIPFHEAICICIGYISSFGYPYPLGKCEVTVNGVRHKILPTRTETVFYPEIKYIS